MALATGRAQVPIEQGPPRTPRHKEERTCRFVGPPGGRLARRIWERGASTTYTYNNAGEISTVDYSDSTPDVTLTYDRRGRQLTAAQSGGNTAVIAYNDQDQVISQTWSAGSLNGLVLTLSYDQYLRRTNLNVNTGTAIQNAYAYDNASRMQKAWQGAFSADYAYTTNSPLDPSERSSA